MQLLKSCDNLKCETTEVGGRGHSEYNSEFYCPLAGRFRTESRLHNVFNQDDLNFSPFYQNMFRHIKLFAGFSRNGKNFSVPEQYLLKKQCEAAANTSEDQINVGSSFLVQDSLTLIRHLKYQAVLDLKKLSA